MGRDAAEDSVGEISLQPVTKDNWREVIKVTVAEPQYEFVGRPDFYLTMCAYGELWRPLAVYLGERVIGFLMWAVDPADGSCWLGGIMVDKEYQGRGFGRRAIQTAVNMLAQEYDYKDFALSYNPNNTLAKKLYMSLGFVQTAEWEDDEVVARVRLEGLYAV